MPVRPLGRVAPLPEPDSALAVAYFLPAGVVVGSSVLATQGPYAPPPPKAYAGDLARFVP